MGRYGPLLGLLLVCVVLSALSVPAYAQAPEDPRAGPRLIYEKGPSGCISEAEFRHEVSIVLDGVDHFRPSASDAIHVWFLRKGNDYAGAVEYVDEHGAKRKPLTVIHENCEVVARWVAGRVSGFFPPAPPPPRAAPSPTCDPCTAVAGAMDELAVLRREIDAAKRWNREQQRRIEELEALDAAVWKRFKKADMDFSTWLAAGALLTANFTKDPGPGWFLSAEARLRNFSIGLEGRMTFPAEVIVARNTPLGILNLDFTQVTAVLTPCGRVSYFFGCGIVGAGMEVHHDSDVPSPVNTTHWIMQFGARLGTEVPIKTTPLAVRAWGEVLYTVPSTGNRYHLINAETGKEDVYTWTRAPVGVFLGLGLVLRIGGKEEQ